MSTILGAKTWLSTSNSFSDSDRRAATVSPPEELEADEAWDETLRIALNPLESSELAGLGREIKNQLARPEYLRGDPINVEGVRQLWERFEAERIRRGK